MTQQSSAPLRHYSISPTPHHVLSPSALREGVVSAACCCWHGATCHAVYNSRGVISLQAFMQNVDHGCVTSSFGLWGVDAYHTASVTGNDDCYHGCNWCWDVGAVGDGYSEG